MGIKEDGHALLKALVGNEGGHATLGSEDFHHAAFAAWAISRFNDAIKWLLKKGYIEEDESLGSAPYEMRTLTVTMDGRLMAESIEPTVSMDSVLVLNRNARKLLVVLHHCYLKAGGNPFGLHFDEEITKETGLDYPAYKQAGQRLVDRGLADWVGHAVLTSTPSGVDAAEDPLLLARVLPIPDHVEEEELMPTPDKKKVFVIHGRCEAARHEMGVFLRSLGLEPVWFRDVRKNMGGTTHVIKVVEQGMKEAHGIIALITPDEYSVLGPTMRKPGEAGEMVARWQARPNVIFEAGMAYMRHPDRVAFVLFGDAKLFSDTAGMCVFWPTNDHGPDSDRAQLRDLLGGGMQCEINAKHDWMTSGDFNTVINGLAGVSPLDPFRSAP